MLTRNINKNKERQLNKDGPIFLSASKPNNEAVGIITIRNQNRLV